MTRILAFVFLLALALLTGPARAQSSPPPGAYPTAAAYRHRQPRPGGIDAFYPDKRGQVVVVARQGQRTARLRVAPDSTWGYASAKGRTFRLYRAEEYRLEHADTLCVYSSLASSAPSTGSSGLRPGSVGGQATYYFSLGLTGLIFPLTVRYLRELYAASNPAFVAALGELRFGQSLSDYDRATGLFRVTTVYRAATR